MVKLVLLLWIGNCFAQEGPAIFSPVDESLLSAGAVRVIGRATGKAELLLDGKPVVFASPGPGAILAETKLTDGAHELVLKGEGGEAKARVFVGKEHNGWKIFQTHPPGGVSCDTCHAVKNDTWALKRATLSPLCHTCHDKGKFPLVHTHNTDTLVDCQNCHMPHGSAAKGHLRMEKAVACKTCHS